MTEHAFRQFLRKELLFFSLCPHGVTRAADQVQGVSGLQFGLRSYVVRVFHVLRRRSGSEGIYEVIIFLKIMPRARGGTADPEGTSAQPEGISSPIICRNYRSKQPETERKY